MEQTSLQIKEKIRKVNLSIYPSTLEKAKEISKEQGRSVSNFFRWVVDHFYKQYKDETDAQ